MERQTKRRFDDIIGGKNAEEIAEGGEEWRQYVVAEMGLKDL